MLATHFRLNLKKSFKFVVGGKKLSGRCFNLFYRFGENGDPLVGISISSKYFKKAHDRNRARRLASTVIQSHYMSLPKRLNLIIIPNNLILTSDSQTMDIEMTRLLNLIK